MSKFCGNCGKIIEEDNGFCSNCGVSIGSSTSTNNNRENVYNQSDKQENKGFKTASLILGIISIVLSLIFNFLIIPVAIIGLILGIVYTSKSKKFCAGIVLNILGIIIPIAIIGLLILVYTNVNASISDLWGNEIYDDYYNDSYNNEYNDNENSNEDDMYLDEEDTSNGSVDINEGNYFKEIKLNDVINFIDNKNSFILVISQTGCSHCLHYKPKIKNIANKYKLTVYYIEYDLLSSSEKKAFSSYISFSGTPDTLFFKDGIENQDERISGDTDERKIELILKNNGYIK